MPIFEWRSVMPASADEVFAYHARPGAFRRLAPPWQKLEVLEESGDVTGGRVAFDVWFGPVRRHWVAEMGSAMPGRQFVDRQVEGPFASWEHVHRFVPIDEGKSELLDHVEYHLPAGGLTDAVGEGPAGKTLSRLFRFRHERTRLDLGRHAEWADRPRLKVAIAGASGLIGSHLTDYLTTAGHRVVRLVRNKEAGPDEIPWDPSTGALYHGALEGVDAIVNLAAVSLFGIWTPGRKKAILSSRVQSTRTLAEAIARMESPPSVFINASAVGAYGSRGGEAITEQTASGCGLPRRRLPGLGGGGDPGAGCRRPPRDPPPRDRHQRGGGSLGHDVAAVQGRPRRHARRRPPVLVVGGTRRPAGGVRVGAARRGARGRGQLHGSGASHEPRGHQNAGPCAAPPGCAGGADLRPASRPGGLGDEMLLASQRALPARLKERGFRFAFPTLDGALRYELGRS